MEIDDLPEHLLVLGGGYIGLEFGQLFHRWAAVSRSFSVRQQLMPREDADVAAALTTILL